MSSPYEKATFLLSVAEIAQLPPDIGAEVAIVGRSNAGKSSVLNRLTRCKGLARVSKTPGRTQMVNMFSIDEHRRLADLPGYGFAKVPQAVKLKWQETVDTYIQTRESLRGLLLVMDIRHPFKPLDLELLNYCAERGLPVHVLLNKADKFSKGAIAKLIPGFEKVLEPYEAIVSYQTFSALRGIGIDELRVVMDTWYGY